MSRTYRKNKKGKVVCEKDADYTCKCSYCTGEVYWKKEGKQVNKETRDDLPE